MGPDLLVGRSMAGTNRRTTNPLHRTAGAAVEGKTVGRRALYAWIGGRKMNKKEGAEVILRPLEVVNRARVRQPGW